MLSPSSRLALDARVRSGERAVGAGFRRMRPDGQGGMIQRFEVRFDGNAGCLRTPAGGSSLQRLLVIEDGQVRSRPLTPREAARLMGLTENYKAPARQTEALQLFGDGVAVPVVKHVAKTLIEPVLGANACVPQRRSAPAPRSTIEGHDGHPET